MLSGFILHSVNWVMWHPTWSHAPLNPGRVYLYFEISIVDSSFIRFLTGCFSQSKLNEWYQLEWILFAWKPFSQLHWVRWLSQKVLMKLQNGNNQVIWKQGQRPNLEMKIVSSLFLQICSSYRSYHVIFHILSEFLLASYIINLAISCSL